VNVAPLLHASRSNSAEQATTPAKLDPATESIVLRSETEDMASISFWRDAHDRRG
jgi:hypothetical protein